MSNTKQILVSSCGTACVTVFVDWGGTGLAVDGDGEFYSCLDPGKRPNAWSSATRAETWFMAVRVLAVAPWCSKCGARYKVVVHDEFWPGCACGAPVTNERPTVNVFQLEEVWYTDQHGFKRTEKRKREVRTLKLIGIETHNAVLVYVAVDDFDNVYTKAIGGGLGWTTGGKYWFEKCERRLIPCT